MEIENITKGSGKQRIHFTTNTRYIGSPCYVDSIHAEQVSVGRGIHNDITILTYIGYKDGIKKFEMEAIGGILITFKDSENES